MLVQIGFPAANVSGLTRMLLDLVALSRRSHQAGLVLLWKVENWPPQEDECGLLPHECG